ncbi:MAG: metal ABC transporter solute-binding protein, Zn/Mn family [Nitriliruptoraceae bacterium]
MSIGPIGPRHRRGTRLAAAVALAVVLAACASGESGQLDGPTDPEQAAESGAGAEDPGADGAEDPGADGAEGAEGEAGAGEVVVTTSILGDIVSNLVGDQLEVRVLMPPGADPHGFEPSADDGRRLREAELVVANGLELEAQMLDVLDTAEQEGVEVITLAERLDPLAYGLAGHDDGEHADHEDDGHEDDEHADHEDDEHADHEDDEHADHEDDEHAHDGDDPHFWFDPVRTADAVDLLAEELTRNVTSLDAAELEASAADYRAQILAVHERIDAWFDTIPDDERMLVTNHESLGYLADRYGFEVVGTVIPGDTTDAQQDPAGFAQLVETVESTGVPAVFAENTDSTVLAEQLRSEVLGRDDLDLEVVELYTGSLGPEGSGAASYLGLLETNAELITEALGGEVS